MNENISIELIVACDNKFGIGKDNKLPWSCPDDLKLFREITKNNVLIMGRNTVDNLPVLKDRIILCLSRTKGEKEEKKNIFYFDSADKAVSFYKENYRNEKKLFVAGGERIYSLFLTTYNISRIHLSRIQKTFDCDAFLCGLNLNNYKIEKETHYNDFIYQILIPSDNDGEKQYLNLLKTVLQSNSRQTRNGETKSIFMSNLVFDIDDGFPLLTTKKMFFKGIVEELLFFLKGETNSKILEEKGISIWKGNTNREFLNKNNMEKRKEGIMGPMYGYQWRFFGSPYNEETGKPEKNEKNEKSIDQLEYVINTLKTDPHSRRILLIDYNPLQAFQGVLFPCHSIINQFYVNNENELEMSCYNRSQDLFLGTPFNIASSALLLMIIAKLTNLKPKKLHMILGDTHIYKEHYDVVQTQLKRQRFSFCKVTIPNISKIEDINNLTWENFPLENYFSHPSIKANMIA